MLREEGVDPKEWIGIVGSIWSAGEAGSVGSNFVYHALDRVDDGLARQYGAVAPRAAIVMRFISILKSQ